MSAKPLPSKEAALFKQVIKCHELKQYKKAVKLADQILKKVPEHGETLAMKGLCLRNLAPDTDKEKKEEAYELVRKGLKFDLKSHVCWHVYGLLYRHDHDYKEAIKCYLNALRIDKENIQIMRDLSLLQVQTRDLPGFVETRRQLLAAKPSNRSHWVTFAVAHHVAGNTELAVQVLHQFEATLDEVPSGEAYEHSEMLLYCGGVMAEAGRCEEALAYLDARQDKIKDRQGLSEARAALLQRLGRCGEAAALYRGLLRTNPNDYRHHAGLRGALGLEAGQGGELTEAQRAALTVLYGELAAEHPGSSAVRRIPLDFMVGDAFAAAASAYLRRGLSRGVPSLFVDLRPLLADPAKAACLQGLVEGAVDSLRGTGRFPPPPSTDGAAAPAAPAADGSPAPESPQTLVWGLLFLARLYDRQGRHSAALALLDEALAHTPTCVELHVARSKVLRHAGDLEGAACVAEAARRLDLQDRYLNSVAVKALLAAGHTATAERTAALFTREGDGGGFTLYDMQHMWYEVAAGRAHASKLATDPRAAAGPALKKFMAVVTHFADIHEDQFDFHTYCIRKGTLRAYRAMLRLMDELYGHPFYGKAATGAVRVYLRLHDRPLGAGAGEGGEAEAEGADPEARRRAKLARKKEEKERAKRAAEEREREERERRERDKAAGGKGGKKPAAASKREPDPDPDGAALAAAPDPLAEAAKLVVRLVSCAAERLESHVLAAEVALRRGRAVVAAGAVRRAAALAAGGGAHPEVHVLVVRLALAVAAAPPAHPTVAAVVGAALDGLLGGRPLPDYCAAWAAAHGGASLAHRLAAATAAVARDGSAAGREAAAASVLEEDVSARPPRHAEAVAAHQLLQREWGAEAAAAAWAAKCGAAFPHSRYFGGPKLLDLAPYGFDFEAMRDAFGRLSFV